MEEKTSSSPSSPSSPPPPSSSPSSKKGWSIKKVMSKDLWPWRFSSVFRWKRVDFQMTVLDDVVYKILSVVEAVVLVSTLCFFFLCCGCHI